MVSRLHFSICLATPLAFLDPGDAARLASRTDRPHDLHLAWADRLPIRDEAL